MTRRLPGVSRFPNGIVLVELEGLRVCSCCGKKTECRPYGESGADVCFKCAFATGEKAERTRANFARMLSTEPPS
jgi:hypothetical protein